MGRAEDQASAISMGISGVRLGGAGGVELGVGGVRTAVLHCQDHAQADDGGGGVTGDLGQAGVVGDEALDARRLLDLGPQRP
jgi:hypothetical protein